MSEVKSITATELVAEGYDLDGTAMDAARRAGQDLKLMSLSLIWGHGFADAEVGSADGPGGHIYRVAQWTVRTDEDGRAGYVRHETVAEAQSRIDSHPANASDDYEHESGDGNIAEPDEAPLIDAGDMLANDGVGRPPVADEDPNVSYVRREVAKAREAVGADEEKAFWTAAAIIGCLVEKSGDTLAGILAGLGEATDGLDEDGIVDFRAGRGVVRASYRPAAPEPSEPSDLDIALIERHGLLGFGAVGPLTKEQHERIEAYEQYCAEAEAEHELELKHGGRERCPECNEFAVTRHVVNPADPTVYRHCRNCDYSAM